LAVAAVCNLLTPALTDKASDFIQKYAFPRKQCFDVGLIECGRCQTYEGGFGGLPDNEAHGGYTFCAVAALHLLNRLDAIDSAKLTVYSTSLFFIWLRASSHV
jgi:prenyltransferase beta subunit